MFFVLRTIYKIFALYHIQFVTSHSILPKLFPYVCENSSFDLRSIFIKLNNLLATNNYSLSDKFTSFNDFVLNNTQIKHLPKNLFVNIIFLNIILYNNPLLNSIDAFDNAQSYVEHFQTFNTSLSDSDELCIMLRQFKNLKVLNMVNDKLKSIPDYAFNHIKFEYIWLCQLVIYIYLSQKDISHSFFFIHLDSLV